MDIFQNCISDRAGIVTQIDSEHKILIIKGDNSDLLHLQLFPRGVMFLVTDSQKYVFGAESIYSFSELPHVGEVLILFYSTVAYHCIQLEDQIVTYFP